MWLSSQQYPYPPCPFRELPELRDIFRRCGNMHVRESRAAKFAKQRACNQFSRCRQIGRHAATFSILPRLAASTRMHVDSFTAACKIPNVRCDLLPGTAPWSAA